MKEIISEIVKIRYGCAGTCFGFGASAVGICDIAPAIARLLGFFAGVAFMVCTVTFFAEVLLEKEKKNEPDPAETEQTRHKRKIYDDSSIAENLGLVNGLEDGEDD